MSEEEIIREIKLEIEIDTSENCMFAKWLDIKVIEGLLDLYTEEKEKRIFWRDKYFELKQMLENLLGEI